MVRAYLAMILATFIVVFSFSTGVRIVILKSPAISIPESFISNIRNKLYNTVESFDLNPDERPARYGLIFHITNFRENSKKIKKILFIRDDKNGNYVYFSGSYYKAYHTLYEYDYKRKKFIPNKYGNYVRLSNYIWARSEEEKFVYFTGFYRKVVTYKNYKKYWLYASITFIDFKTSFVLYQKSYVFIGNSYKNILENININLRKNEFYSEKPTIAFYEDTLSPLGGFVKKYFYQEERYTMYDRSYLNYLFKEMKFQDLISSGEEVGTYLKPARYLVVVKILNKKYKLIESTEYIEFSNPINGEFLDKKPVYAGIYYRFDSKTGKYIPDRKKGSYVKVKRGVWAQEDEYISAGSFNDLFIENISFHSYFIDALVMVIDGKNGNLRVAKKFTIYLKFPESIREDRFGSTRGYYKEDVIKETYDRLGKEISDYVRQFFAIETEVNGVNGNMITINAGNNYGVKRGYYFRITDKGFTQGYVKITDVKEKSSLSKVVRYLRKVSKIKIGDNALEDFDYSPFLGIDISLNLTSDEVYLETGHTSRNIYANKNYSFGMIIGSSANELLLGGYAKWYMLFNKSFALAPKSILTIASPYDESESNTYTTKFKVGLEINYPFYETIFKPHISGISGFIYWKYPMNNIGLDIGAYYSF